MTTQTPIRLRSLITLFVLCLCCGRALAQRDFTMYEDRKFYGGLTMGGNFCQVDGDYFAGYYKVGVNVGGVMYARLSEHWAGSLEILYSQKGSKSNGARAIGSGVVITDYGINLNYAEIPVMLNYYDDGKSFWGAGLSYSRLGTSNETVTTDPPQVYNQSQFPFRKSDVNLLLGASLHLYKGLFVNARFQYSVLPIRDNIPQSYTRSGQYNNLWVFRLMYLFM